MASSVLERLPPRWADDLTGKAPNTRKTCASALLEIAPTIGESDNCFEVVGFVKQLLADNNVFVLVEAAKCAKALAVALARSFASYSTEIVDMLVNGLGNKDKKIVTAYHEALEAMLEYGGAKISDIIPLALSSLTNKNPALRRETMVLVARAADKMARLEKGLMIDLVKALVPQLDDKDEPVRKAAMEAFARLVAVGSGPGILSTVDPKKAEKIRALASEGAAAAAPAAKIKATSETVSSADIETSPALSAAPAPEVVFEAYDMAVPTEILARLGENWAACADKAAPAERREDVEKLLKVLQTAGPRLSPEEDFGDVMAALRKMVCDKNVFVCVASIKCIRLLALGLREAFVSHAQNALECLVDGLKAKDKKVLDALHETFDAVLSKCGVSIVELQQFVLAALTDKKSPGLCREVLSLTIRAADATPNIVKAIAEDICKAIVPLLTDRDEQTRKVAGDAIAHVLAGAGPRVATPVLATIKDAKKVEKIQAEMAAAPPRKAPAAKAGPKAAPTGAAKKGKAPALAITDAEEKENVLNNSGSRPAAPTGKAGVVASPLALRKAAPAAKAPAAKKSLPKPAPVAAAPVEPVEEETIPMNPAPAPAPTPVMVAVPAPASAPVVVAAPTGPAVAIPEVCKIPEAETVGAEAAAEIAAAGELIPLAMIEALRTGTWKEKVPGVEQLAAFVETMRAGSSDAREMGRNAEVIIRLIGSKEGVSWSEPNVYVMAAVFNLVTSLAGEPAFNKASAGNVIPALAKRLSEKKILESVTNCLDALSEAVSPAFVFTELMKATDQEKSPKVLQGALEWMKSAAAAFGVKGLPIKPLVDYLRNAAASSNAAVRTATVAVFVQLFLSLRDGLKAMLSDMKPATVKVIDDECAKFADQKAPEPTRFYRRDPTLAKRAAAAAAVAAGVAVPAAALTEEDPMECIPRTDVSKQIKDALCAELADKSWQVKKAALEKVQAIVNAAGKRIKPTIDNLIQALKGPLAERNANVVVLTAGHIAFLVAAMGKGSDKYVRVLVPLLLNQLGDTKPAVRTAAGDALAVWARQTGIAPMVQLVFGVLASDSSVAKKEAAAWISANAQLFQVAFDRAPLVETAITALQDKLGEVRSVAEQLTQSIAFDGHYAALSRAANNLPKAAQTGVLPVVQKFRSGGSGAGTPGPLGVATAVPTAVMVVARAAPVAAPPPAPAPVVASAPTPVKAAPAPVAKKAPVVEKPAAVEPPPAAKAPAVKGAKRLVLKREGTERKVAEPAPEAPVAQPPALVSNVNKEARAKKGKGECWAFEERGNAALFDRLRDDCKGCFTPAMADLALSKDFKNHVKVLTILTNDLASPAVTFENLDVVLKWVTLVLDEGNTVTVGKATAYLDALCCALRAASLPLSDFEASLLVPVVVEKMGSGKDATRKALSALVKHLPQLLPSSKLFAFLLDGVKSKNWRTRASALLEVRAVLARFGMSVCVPARDLPRIAVALSDGEAKVRDAAMAALFEAQRIQPDKFWKHLDGLQRAQREALESRLKTMTASAPVFEDDEDEPEPEPEPVEEPPAPEPVEEAVAPPGFEPPPRPAAPAEDPFAVRVQLPRSPESAIPTQGRGLARTPDGAATRFTRAATPPIDMTMEEEFAPMHSTPPPAPPAAPSPRAEEHALISAKPPVSRPRMRHSTSPRNTPPPASPAPAPAPPALQAFTPSAPLPGASGYSYPVSPAPSPAGVVTRASPVSSAAIASVINEAPVVAAVAPTPVVPKRASPRATVARAASPCTPPQQVPHVPPRVRVSPPAATADAAAASPPTRSFAFGLLATPAAAVRAPTLDVATVAAEFASGVDSRVIGAVEAMKTALGAFAGDDALDAGAVRTLMGAVIKEIHVVFATETLGPRARRCKHLLNGFLLLVKHGDIAHALVGDLAAEVLEDLVIASTSPLLLRPEARKDDALGGIIRAIDYLIRSVLDRGNPTEVCSGLLRCLMRAAIGVDSPARGRRRPLGHEFVAMVCKALLSLWRDTTRVDAAACLRSVAAFFGGVAIAGVDAGEVSNRTVRTIVGEAVRVCGEEAARAALAEVDASEPAGAAGVQATTALVDQLVASAAAKTLTATPRAARTAVTPGRPSVSAPVVPSVAPVAVASITVPVAVAAPPAVVQPAVSAAPAATASATSYFAAPYASSAATVQPFSTAPVAAKPITSSALDDRMGTYLERLRRIQQKFNLTPTK